jgi:hypothetical protein
MASTDRHTRPRGPSVGPLDSDHNESGRRVRFGEVDRECADARDVPSRERFRAAGFARVACPRTSPDGTALSGWRCRNMSEADTPLASDRCGGGIGPARRGPRRGAAVVDFVAAVRLRGSRTTAALEGGVDLVAGSRSAVAARLPPSAVLPLPAVRPRRGLTGVLRPLALWRELIHG